MTAVTKQSSGNGESHLNRGKIVLSYREVATLLEFPVDAQVQWVEENLNRSSISIFVDCPGIPALLPGKLFPQVVWNGECWKIVLKE